MATTLSWSCRSPTVTSLTAERLSHFERLRIVTLVNTSAGPRYHSLDVQRITWLGELIDDFGVKEGALEIIISLLDQLQGARSKFEQMMQAVGAKPS